MLIQGLQNTHYFSSYTGKTIDCKYLSHTDEDNDNTSTGSNLDKLLVLLQLLVKVEARVPPWVCQATNLLGALQTLGSADILVQDIFVLVFVPLFSLRSDECSDVCFELEHTRTQTYSRRSSLTFAVSQPKAESQGRSFPELY